MNPVETLGVAGSTPPLPSPLKPPTLTPPAGAVPLDLVSIVENITQLTPDHRFHKRAMFEVILHTRAQRVLETGTDVGDSARIFATALRITGGSIITVDQRDCDQSWAVKDFPNVKFVKGDATQIQTNQALDVLYIDDHWEGTDIQAHVTNELGALGKWVRKGGWILIDDSLHDKFGVGITAAVRAWCKENDLVWYEDCQGNGMVFIEVTRDLAVKTA